MLVYRAIELLELGVVLIGTLIDDTLTFVCFHSRGDLPWA